MKYRRFSLVAVALAFFGLSSKAVVPEKARLKDDAGLLESASAKRLDKDLTQLQKTFRRNVYIDTLSRVSASTEPAFTEWVGKRYSELAPRSVHILLVKDPTYVVVTASPDLREMEFTHADRDQLTNLLIYSLSRRENEVALSESIVFLRNLFSNRIQGTDLPLPSAPEAVFQSPVNEEAPTCASSLLLWGGVLALALLLGVIAKSVFKGPAEHSPT